VVWSYPGRSRPLTEFARRDDHRDPLPVRHVPEHGSVLLSWSGCDVTRSSRVELGSSGIARIAERRSSVSGLGLAPFRPHEAPDEGLVFVTDRGYAVNGSWLTKHFQALLARAGLPKMRLHDLRHGAASLLVGAGVRPRIAQELLRHASNKTTMEIYSHVSAAQQREAVEVLQRALAESHAESHAQSDLSGAEWP
jgi:hypothetical protein